MPRPARSLESMIKEHRRFREQCRRRIRSGIVVSAVILGGVAVASCFLGVNFWVIGGAVAFVASNLGVEIDGYRYHTRRLQELSVLQGEPRD